MYKGYNWGGHIIYLSSTLGYLRVKEGAISNYPGTTDTKELGQTHGYVPSYKYSNGGMQTRKQVNEQIITWDVL